MSKKKSTGLNQKLNLSEELSEFMGKDTASRAEITKEIWSYIKSEGLQDEDDGRIIYPDDVLAPILGKTKINMMKIAGCVSKHIIK